MDNLLAYMNIKIKLLDDGNLIYAEPFSNDLVLVDTDMREIARLKGYPIDDAMRDSASDFNKNRRSCFSDDDTHVLWLKGLS